MTIDEKKMKKIIDEMRDHAAQHFESTVNLCPFYVGHHDVDKNAVSVATKNGSPVVWICTKLIPIEVALSIATMIAKMLNEKYDTIMKEYDNQTGKVTSFKESLETSSEAMTSLFHGLFGINPDKPNQ